MALDGDTKKLVGGVLLIAIALLFAFLTVSIATHEIEDYDYQYGIEVQQVPDNGSLNDPTAYENMSRGKQKLIDGAFEQGAMSGGYAEVTVDDRLDVSHDIQPVTVRGAPVLIKIEEPEKSPKPGAKVVGALVFGVISLLAFVWSGMVVDDYRQA